MWSRHSRRMVPIISRDRNLSPSIKQANACDGVNELHSLDKRRIRLSSVMRPSSADRAVKQQSRLLNPTEGAKSIHIGTVRQTARARSSWMCMSLKMSNVINRAIRGVTPALSACRRPLHRRLSESEKPVARLSLDLDEVFGR